MRLPTKTMSVICFGVRRGVTQEVGGERLGVKNVGGGRLGVNKCGRWEMGKQCGRWDIGLLSHVSWCINVGDVI